MSGALDVTLLAAAIGCAVLNTVEVVAKAMRARFVLDNCAEVGLDSRWLPQLAVVEGAGVAGLVLGFAGVPLIGAAAAIGLVGFFAIAVAVHVRARVLHNLAFPAVFLALAVGAVGHFV
ncbi:MULTISPECIES: DoxX family protein [Prauserella salsuginis group]|uniref:DoxX family protein n=1 Tax=Prauserella salsuginis TaxID=387889 RepID=A0ABW6GB05_9PSEU|nr:MULTISPECIES: DoxX family protein [Prauserella salsuginis group]MCR3720649.1 DoxX-like family protein [Prauserella flava]MCR3735270.1 DoxX-like family protein [Prauserella salsuginis]